MILGHLILLFVILVLPVLVVGDLPFVCFLSTSHLLLVLGVPVDSLHHNVVTILRVDLVVSVDVPLEGAAQDPPLHKIMNKNSPTLLLH